MQYHMKKKGVAGTRAGGRALLGLLMGATALVAVTVQSGTPPKERRAIKVDFEFPFVDQVLCPGDDPYSLDGLALGGTISVKGVAHVGVEFFEPWEDNAGGKHLTQNARVFFEVEGGGYTWSGRGVGQYTIQGGGGNGDHVGGVFSFQQHEYYFANEGQPDLSWSADIMSVVDANGNIRVSRAEGEPLTCVSD